MSPFRWRSAAVLLAASASGVLAQGKEPLSQPSTVPIDLVTALVASAGVPGPTVPRILVGTAPEWVLPRIALPNGAKIAGSAFSGYTVLTIVNVPGATDSVIVQARDALVKRGWKLPPPPPNYNTYGGFRPAPTTQPALGTPADRATLCDGSELLTATLVRRDANSADIAYRIFTANGMGGQCNPYRPTPPSTMAARVPMPTLINPPVLPPDAGAVMGCSANAEATQNTGTWLHTAMTPEAIVDHYAAQLADSGWKPAGDKNGIIGRTFTRTDTAGTVLEVSLTVTSPPRSELCHDVTMQVRALRKP